MALTKAFANTGDKVEFSVESDPSGDMSWEKGFTALFQLNPQDGGLYLDRQKFNQMMFEISNAIIELQNGVVKLTGNQTIAGTKTFSSTIAGSINGNAATVTNGVYTTGNQTIAGTKTFSALPVCATAPTANNQLANKAYVDTQTKSISQGFNTLTRLTASGTYTAPVTGWYKITCIGGGGGGGGGGSTYADGGGGGGSGGLSIAYQKLTANSKYNYSIGAGGAGGAINANGNNGGNTTFTGTSTITANGGGGGGAGTSSGAGGGGGNGTYLKGFSGGAGGFSSAFQAGDIASGGNGGGFGGAFSIITGRPANATANTGGGGAGGLGGVSGLAYAGSSGGSGVIFIEYYA